MSDLNMVNLKAEEEEKLGKLLIKLALNAFIKVEFFMACNFPCWNHPYEHEIEFWVIRD